jgi:glycosyltransferase involved in cell wall biosynthesis
MQLVLSLAPGGTERLAVELVTRLSPSFPMVVCCLDDEGKWAGELAGCGVPVVALHREPGFHPSLGARIARVADEHGVSVIHSHHYSPFVYGRIATFLNRRLRLIFTEHGRYSDAPPITKRKVANTLLARLPGPMFAVSLALREHMIAEGFPARRVGVIHNGIDPGPVPDDSQRRDARRRLGVPDDAFVVGTAARLDPVKDLGTLIAAIGLLRARVPSAMLVVVGEGEERPALEAAIRERQLSGAVRLMGYDPQVRGLLPGMDVYVNSSVSEGVSLTILEAMAAALPVVATQVGGTPEVVLHGTTGVLVEARSPQAIATALEALAGDPARRRSYGLAGRARVEEAFTIDRMVADYAREYRALGTN